MDVAHVSNRFEATAQHSVLSTANFDGDERVQISRATVASSLVLAGGRVSISRPVREAFAIVSRHQTLAKNQILIDRTENGVRAQSDGLGSDGKRVVEGTRVSVRVDLGGRRSI